MPINSLSKVVCILEHGYFILQSYRHFFEVFGLAGFAEYQIVKNIEEKMVLYNIMYC